MKARESVSHEQAAGLLPWLVNDTLDAGEKENVLEHALACVICHPPRACNQVAYPGKGECPRTCPSLRHLQA